MASTMRMWLWPLCLLAVHCLVLSTGQNYEASEYLSKFNYELGQAGQDVSSDADSSAQVKTLPNDDEDSSMINFEPLGMVQEDVMTDSNAKDVEGPIDIPVADIKEPVVVRKEAFCLGCPTVIDLSIPENRNAIHKYLETPVSELLSQSPYKSVTPTILSATKQVESNIKYAITFAIDLTQYNENESASGEEGSPPERRVCAIEFVLDGPETKFEYNNCTADMFANSPAKAPESDESGVDPLLELSQMVKDEVKQEMKPIDFDESTQNSKDSLVVENVRKRRSSEQGALRDIDKNEQDLVYRFAELAVRTLDEVDPDNNKRILLGVTEAKKQIVNGIMYHLVMQVGTSTCQENEEGHSGDGCVENQLYPEKMCRVKILRSWADESPLNAKVVRCECADVWPEDLPSEPLWSGRTRRSTQDNWPSTDGWKDYDLKDGSQSDCLEKVMTSFQDVLNVKDVSKVATIRDAHTRVNKETSQPEMVVTIVLTDTAKLKMMGDVKKPMVVSSRVVCSQRLKRSSPGPGGLSDADVNDPYVKEITQFGLSEIQKSVNSPYQHVLVRIIEAKRQVVAGTLFHFKFEIGPTSCLKTDQSSTNQNCNATSSEQLLLCSFKVWDQPWTKLREIKDLDCGASRSKREVLLGGLQDISVEDPYVKELAAFALAEIDKGLNSPYQQKVVRVVEAKTQVVAGTLMRLKLELAKTNCLKSGSVAAAECVHSADEPTTMCSVKVVDQAWLNKRELLDVQCGRTRSKRDISSQTSGAKDAAHKTSSSKPVFLHVDVDDLYIKSLAKYAIGEIDRQTNTPYHHKLLHIVSSQVEHTSVTKVKLGLYLTLSSCKKSSRYKACPVLTGAPRQMCNVELFHSAIPPEMTAVTNINCDGHKMNAPHNEGFAEENGDVHAELFRGFMRRFNRTYASDEELQKRYQIFQQNMKYIQRIQDQEQGTARYGPTIFADLTPTEFKNTYLGLKPNLRQENAIPALKADIPNIKLPTSFDWRDHNAVTPVKNQGACGSCWAFAVTGNLEGQYAIKHGKLLSLSEQELVDCDTLDDGCKGGLPDNAYHALEQLGGIELEKDYPYEGADEQCHFNSSIARVHVKSSVNITTNEEDMAKWLVKNGPIAIGINANAMQFYMGGVSHPLHFLCSPDNLDHGVLIVGYGVHTTSIRHKILPYWIVKNSWGTFWGEKGYYRVFRGDGSCGVNQMASSAVVD